MTSYLKLVFSQFEGTKLNVKKKEEKKAKWLWHRASVLGGRNQEDSLVSVFTFVYVFAFVLVFAFVFVFVK